MHLLKRGRKYFARRVYFPRVMSSRDYHRRSRSRSRSPPLVASTYISLALACCVPAQCSVVQRFHCP